jgi:hypothetical protein
MACFSQTLPALLGIAIATLDFTVPAASYAVAYLRIPFYSEERRLRGQRPPHRSQPEMSGR